MISFISPIRLNIFIFMRYISPWVTLEVIFSHIKIILCICCLRSFQVFVRQVTPAHEFIHILFIHFLYLEWGLLLKLTLYLWLLYVGWRWHMVTLTDADWTAAKLVVPMPETFWLFPLVGCPCRRWHFRCS